MPLTSSECSQPKTCKNVHNSNYCRQNRLWDKAHCIVVARTTVVKYACTTEKQLQPGPPGKHTPKQCHLLAQTSPLHALCTRRERNTAIEEGQRSTRGTKIGIRNALKENAVVPRCAVRRQHGRVVCFRCPFLSLMAVELGIGRVLLQSGSPFLALVPSQVGWDPPPLHNIGAKQKSLWRHSTT